MAATSERMTGNVIAPAPRKRPGARPTEVTVSAAQDKPRPCECGCGGLTTVHRGKAKRFITGHNARRPAAARFWARAAQGAPGECWLWQGPVINTGYGRIHVEGRDTLAHRFAYELLVGPIPEGLVIDHLCRTPRCVNPTHMEVVTFRENVLRGEAPTARHARKTHCKRGHPFDEANTRVTAKGRCCRACDRDRARLYAQRKKNA